MENSLYKANNSIFQDSDPRGSKLVLFKLLRSENQCLIREETCRTESEYPLRKVSASTKPPTLLVHNQLMTTR